MQFIRGFVGDIRKCARVFAKTRRWWIRSSKTMRYISASILTMFIVIFLLFVGFETSNVLSTTYQYGVQARKNALIEKNKNNCAGSENNSNRRSLNNNINNTSKNKSYKYCNKSSLKKTNGKSDFWKYPTGGAYPNLTGIKVSDLHIDVNLKKQRVYIIAKGKTVYSMIMSSGIKDSTPHGDYHIDGMRNKHFYNQNEKVGADYWVGFIDAEYLFHSVPTNYNFGEYIASEGMKLGKPASHGCVRLSVADAKWFYENIPDGTSVHIG